MGKALSGGMPLSLMPWIIAVLILWRLWTPSGWWSQIWPFWMHLHITYIPFTAGMYAKILIFLKHNIWHTDIYWWACCASYKYLNTLQPCPSAKHFCICSAVISWYSWHSPRLVSVIRVAEWNCWLYSVLLWFWYCLLPCLLSPSPWIVIIVKFWYRPTSKYIIFS